MLLALRIAMSSDKLLLRNSLKEHKDKHGRWEYNPYATAIFKWTSIWNAPPLLKARNVHHLTGN